MLQSSLLERLKNFGRKCWTAESEDGLVYCRWTLDVFCEFQPQPLSRRWSLFSSFEQIILNDFVLMLSSLGILHRPFDICPSLSFRLQRSPADSFSLYPSFPGCPCLSVIIVSLYFEKDIGKIAMIFFPEFLSQGEDLFAKANTLGRKWWREDRDKPYQKKTNFPRRFS